MREIKEMAFYKKIKEMLHAIKNWDATKDNMALAMKIMPYKNKHKGEACFVIGNGPSLRIDDLTKIHELGIPSFACNRIYLAFPETSWRPSYYFISDSKLLNGYDEHLDGVDEKCRFFPKRFRDTIKKGLFYNDVYFEYRKEGKFSTNAAKCIYPGASVTTEMLQFAYYMGFKEIYLIGVDFSYAVNNPLNSRSYAYQGENNYFIKGYLKEGEVADMPDVTANLLAFIAAKETTEKNGCKIYNATRGGKLEVFDRVDLDKVFEKLGG